MGRFKRGDRVAYLYGGNGTVTSQRGNVVRVLWDDGIETPVHVLEICYEADADRYGFPSQKEKDRSISDQESAAAPTESPSKETIIIQSTDRKPAAERPQIPAGFDWVSQFDGAEDIGYYAGPSAESGTLAVETLWDQEGGIECHVTNTRHADNGIFTREELDTLRGLITEVTEHIDKAATNG